MWLGPQHKYWTRNANVSGDVVVLLLLTPSAHTCDWAELCALWHTFCWPDPNILFFQIWDQETPNDTRFLFSFLFFEMMRSTQIYHLNCNTLSRSEGIGNRNEDKLWNWKLPNFDHIFRSVIKVIHSVKCSYFAMIYNT